MLTIVVLRHALAGERQGWTSDDRSRPLNRQGFQQSLDLVEHLDGLPIDQVLTSPYVRCQHTVSPLAAARGVAVIERPWLAEGATPSEIREGLATIGCDTLVCTHGDCVCRILDAIGADMELPAGFELDKAAALVFRFQGPDVIDAVHLPAPASGRGVEFVRSMAI